jgi:hypothetical protein
LALVFGPHRASAICMDETSFPFWSPAVYSASSTVKLRYSATVCSPLFVALHIGGDI